MSLEEPFQLEIVKDTISADLLDYIKRDIYYTGIERSYDPRILEYFNIAEYDGKRHLVVDITEEGALCRDVLVEMEHLLRVRYTLGERVYNYHTKIAADAMLGKAISEAGIKEDFFFDKGDERVISYIAYGDHGSKVASKIGQAFAARRLLRRCYMLNRDTFDKRIQDFVTRYWRHDEVRQLCKIAEEQLVRKCRNENISIDESELIVFCHEPEMNLKAANVLVREEGKEPEILAKFWPVTEEIMNAHLDLWCFYVFTRRDVVHKVAKVCEEHFRYPNKCTPRPATIY